MMNFLNNKSIILSDCGKILDILSYKEVYKYSDLLKNFISKYIEMPHQYIALRMNHNIYIPSLILSLQELQHPFIFLPNDEAAAESIIKEASISWLLSFRNTSKSVASLRLKDCDLFLEKCPFNENKAYYKDIYYMIRTSGTTGENKFVRVSKYCIESNIKNLSNVFNIKQTDIIYFGTPLTFDPSMIELLLALHNGACLLITTAKNQINPLNLYKTLFHLDNGITVLQIVPSLLLRFSQEQIRDILLNKNLKILAFGGESFPKSVLHYERSPSLRIFNLYGITEVSCWASIYEVPEGVDEVPLGDALEDTLLEIRDKSGERISEGEGEIYIGSNGRICLIGEESYAKEMIFRKSGDIGIINKEGIFYKNRKNDTFKRLGHRLSLSKIEHLIQTETGLLNRCIWSKSQSKLLVFLIIEDFDKKIKDKLVDKVRVKLLHTLPKETFPDFIDIIKKIPITSHGKTDKGALESIFLNRNRTSTKGDDLLKSLICANFGLNVKNLGDIQKATFFELGGNSILAIQILSEFKEETGSESPDLVTALFERDLEACFESVSSVHIIKKRLRTSIDKSIPVKKIKNEDEWRVAWKYNLEACVDSTPLIFEHKGRILAAIGSFSHLFAILDAETGAEISKHHFPDVIEASPCLSPCQNYLYVGCFDGKLYSLDFIENQIKWFYPSGDRIKCKPVTHQENLIFGSYDKNIHCIKNTDGSPVWKINVGESITSAPLINEDRIYIATICGTCFCLKESGEILWRCKSGGAIFGSPCIVEGVVMWPNVQGSILCLTLDGEKIQEFKCAGHLYSSLVSYQSFTIFGCHDQCLYILSSEDGVLVRRNVVRLGDNLTTPCIYKNRIVVAGNSGRLFLVDFQGRLINDFNLPKETFSSVVAHSEKLFVGCRDNNFYCIKMNR